MSLLLVMTALLAAVALVRATGATRRAAELTRQLQALRAEVAALRQELTGKADPPLPEAVPLEAGPAHPQPTGQAEGLWGAAAGPTDGQRFSPAPPTAAPRPPSLWGPEFSRARISLTGGLLVLGGLAFTLRALGAPAWTLLLAVFAFGGLLFFNARRVPWPVSGALRGLGYGVAALGVGSLAQRLPPGWGPGAVMAGLLVLSAALLLDALRRRELLLGTLAVGGAALGTWMLTDDLGAWSIPAAGLTLLLAGAAVGRSRGATAGAADEGGSGPDTPATRRAALTLTLAAAGAVPPGWFVASASHAGDGWAGVGEWTRLTLHLGSGALTLLPWLAFCGLALSVPLALLWQGSHEEGPAQDRPKAAVLAAAWATLAPQVLVAAAVGSALAARPLPPTTPALTGVMIAALVAAARAAWGRHTAREDGSAPVIGALAGSLTAGAAGVAGTLALSVLGPRTDPVALAGLALALLLVGVSGHSRLWVRAGALGLTLTAWWAALGLGSLNAVPSLLAGPPTLRAALLGAVPAAVGLLAALRLAGNGWAVTPRPGRIHRQGKGDAPDPPGSPGPRPRWTPTLLAGAGSGALALALLAGGAAPLLGGLLLAAALLWNWGGPSPEADRPGHTVGFWATAPGLTLGALWLLAGGPPLETGLGVVAALGAGAALLRASPRTFAAPSPRRLTEGVALTLLGLGLARAAQTWWPAAGLPGALAALALLTAPLRLTWRAAGRTDNVLGLGGLALLSTLLAVWPEESAGSPSGAELPALGGMCLAVAWGLTRTAAGRRWLERAGRGRPLPPPQPPVTLTVWLAGWLTVVPLAWGVRLGTQAADLGPWLVGSSAAALAAGLGACLRAQQEAAAHARPLWTVGLAIIVAAGLKGAWLDAGFLANSAAGLGIAVLVTGLSLLAVAILAPRPSAVAPAPQDPAAGPLV